jgi:hypothetical protein
LSCGLVLDSFALFVFLSYLLFHNRDLSCYASNIECKHNHRIPLKKIRQQSKSRALIRRVTRHSILKLKICTGLNNSPTFTGISNKSSDIITDVTLSIMANPQKRQRGDDYEPYFTSHWASNDLAYRLDLIRCIDKVHAADHGAYIKNLLLQLAMSQPGVAAALRGVEATLPLPVQQTCEHVQITSNKFAAYVEDVDRMLNEESCHLSGTRQYDRAPIVFNSVVEIIDSISDEACAQHVPIAIKNNALGSLVQIGRMIIDVHDTLGHEVQKRFGRDAALEDALSRIVNSLTVEEFGRVSKAHGDIRELWELGAGQSLFTELEGVLDALSDPPRTEETAETQE